MRSMTCNKGLRSKQILRHVIQSLQLYCRRCGVGMVEAAFALTIIGASLAVVLVLTASGQVDQRMQDLQVQPSRCLQP